MISLTKIVQFKIQLLINETGAVAALRPKNRTVPWRVRYTRWPTWPRLLPFCAQSIWWHHQPRLWQRPHRSRWCHRNSVATAPRSAPISLISSRASSIRRIIHASVPGSDWPSTPNSPRPASRYANISQIICKLTDSARVWIGSFQANGSNCQWWFSVVTPLISDYRRQISCWLRFWFITVNHVANPSYSITYNRQSNAMYT